MKVSETDANSCVTTNYEQFTSETIPERETDSWLHRPRRRHYVSGVSTSHGGRFGHLLTAFRGSCMKMWSTNLPGSGGRLATVVTLLWTDAVIDQSKVWSIEEQHAKSDRQEKTATNIIPASRWRRLDCHAEPVWQHACLYVSHHVGSGIGRWVWVTDVAPSRSQTRCSLAASSP